MKDNFEIKYAKQLLIDKSKSVKKENIITLSKIKENYERLKEMLISGKGFNTEVKTLEELCKLDMAYLKIMSALTKNYPISIDNLDMELDKIVIATEVDKITEETNKLSTEEDVKKINRRKYNEYRELGLIPRSNLEEVERQYLAWLQIYKKELEKRIESPKSRLNRLAETETIFLQKQKAYESLCDKEYKMRLDENLLMNFDPNQNKLYTREIEKLMYIPDEPSANSYIGRKFILGDINSGDECEIHIQQLGHIGIANFPYTAENLVKYYRIVKKYKDPELREARKKKTKKADSLTIWDEEEDGEVFRVTGDLHESLLFRDDTHSSFINYTAEVLLSNTNLLEAIEHNGGYIGEVVTKDKAPIIDGTRSGEKTEDYTVYHYPDKLCASVEFSTLRNYVDISDQKILLEIDSNQMYQLNLFPRDGRKGAKIAYIPNIGKKGHNTQEGEDR